MASTTFDQKLAEVLARIQASGTGLEHWIDPILAIEPTTPDEEEEKAGILSTIGAILHEPKKRVDIAMNYYTNPYLRDRVLRGEEPVPTGQLAKEAYVAPPDPTQSPTEQHLRAAGRGLMERWVNVSTDPVLFAIPPVMRGAPAAVRAAAGLGFVGAMAKDTVHQADRTYESYKREGWSPSTSEEAAKAAFDVGLLATMVPGMVPRRARGEVRDVTPEEPGPLARRTPVPTRPIPPGRGIPPEVYEAYQAEFLRRRRLGLPPPPPPGAEGAPPPPEGPPPPPPPVGPARPRLREVNVPETPERLADDALLAQIQAIRDGIQNALERGDIERAMELRGHHERLTDVYRTRRYTPEARVGRLGDLMQLRDVLGQELERGPGMARELEIRESLRVLDAEINLARSAQAVEAPAEAAPPAAPGAVPPEAPPSPGVVPPPAAPPGPLPSRAPHVTPGERGPALPPSSPAVAVQEGMAASRQGVQELLERAQAEGTGLPAPPGTPLATVLEGGEPAGAAARARPPGGPPAPPPAAPPARPPVPGEPGGPPLDVEGILAPPGPPRLGRPALRTIPPTEPAEEAAPVVPEEAGARPAPAPPLPTAPAPEERLPVPEKPEGEQVELGEAEVAAAEEPPAGPRRRPLETLPTRRALSPDQARKKSDEIWLNWAEHGGHPFWITRHMAARAPKVRTGARDRVRPDMAAGLARLAGKATVPARPVGWQQGAAAEDQPVWFEGRAKRGKPVYAALDGDYYSTLAKLAAKDPAAEWRIAPASRGGIPAGVGLFAGDGSLLGFAAPLNESGPPPPLAEQAPAAPPSVPPRMKQAARELEAELRGEPVPTRAQPTGENARALEAQPDDPFVYHGTSRARSEKIREKGLPAGSYFSPTAEQALNFGSERSGKQTANERLADAVVFRVPKDAISPSGADPGDVFGDEWIKAGLAVRSSTAVPPDVIGSATEAPAAPDQIAELEGENAALREQRAAQLEDDNARLREKLEETDAAAEGVGVGPPPPEILPGPREEAPGGGQVRGAPPEERGEVEPGVRPGDREGPEPYPGGGAGEGGGVPGAGAVRQRGRGPRAVTTAEPAGVEVEELRADGEERTVEPLPAEPTGKHRDRSLFAWKVGDLDATEGRSLRQKATDNLAALRLLKGIEAEDRPATPDEQGVLASYVGWGGMPRVFKEYDYGPESEFWQEQHKALQELLTPEEYEAAKASVTNAHYTREDVIRAMWQTVGQVGGHRGMRVLEPAMGVGNFLSALPAPLRPVHATGVELDPVSGRIAERLFPGANVHVAGFEATPLPDNYFDLAISNVPFGPFGVSDPRFRDEPHITRRIHNYFFAKALDKVRPGGLVAFVTSHGTLDAKDPAFREHVAERAWLVGAVRLPRTTFERNANTGVTTDLVFLQKKIPDQERPAWAAPDTWTETVPREMTGEYGRRVEARLNRYFEERPEMVLGELAIGDGTAGPNEMTVSGDFDAERLRVALSKLGDPTLLERPTAPPPPTQVATADELRRLKPGNFTVREGKVWQLNPDGTVYEPKLSKAGQRMARDWVPVRDAARDVIATQLEGGSDAQLKTYQRELGKAYDRFVKKHGPVHGRTVKSTLNQDPEFPLTLALEDWKPPQYRKEGRKKVLVSEGKATKRAIFTKRTVAGYSPPTSAESTQAAYGIALAERGAIDVDRVASLLSVTPSEALRRLIDEGFAYEDPANGGQLQTAEEYLSGNVVQKLEQAQAAAELEPERFGRNAAALKAVQPEKLGPKDVTVQLGASWVPPEVYEEFAAVELGGVSAEYWRPGDQVSVRHSEGLGLWKIGYENRLTYSAAATSTYGTARMNALELFDDAMNLRVPTVYDGRGDARVVNDDATALAREKLDLIKERFGGWIFENPERAEGLLAIYNRQWNNQRLRTPDGSHLVFPGMNRAVLRRGDLEPHQKNDVWRILTQPNTLIAEPVGSGKTWTLVAALMEARRMGQVRKPVLAVPNSVFEQWGEEWRKLYPQAKLLIVEPQQLRGKARAETMSRIATEEWDGILVTHEALKSLPVSTKALQEVVREEVALLDQTVREIQEDAGVEGSVEDFVSMATSARRRRGAGLSRSDTRMVKQIEKQKAALKARLKTLYEAAKRDKTISFDELGVDMLLVDEAHYFNSLFFATKLGRVAGISNQNAARAFDLYVKIRSLQRQRNGGGVVFATATPVRNTLAEMYTLFRYLDRPFLQERGLRHFDNWVRAFATARATLELKPTGAGYRPKTRFSAFVNVPELLTAFRNYSAVLTQEDLDLPVPDMAVNSKGERAPNFVEIQPSEGLRAFVQGLEKRAEELKLHRGRPQKGDDNMLAVTTDGRKAAIDLTMVGRAREPQAGQKLDVVRQKVYDIWKRTAKTRGVQAVFLDLSTPDAQPFSAYRWLRDRWVEMGVPADDIAFAHSYDRKTRGALFEKLNRSEIRIVLGSSKKMGVGANFQENLVALHNVDVPWTPDGYEQRLGRALRQGNENAEVEIHNYTTKATFDAYMWQTLGIKAGFIGQVMTGKASARTIEDVSLTYLTAQEALAATSENPIVVKKIQLEADLRKYEQLEGAHKLEVYDLGRRRAQWEREAAYNTERSRNILDAVRQLKEGHTLELFEVPGQEPGAPAAKTFDKRTEEAGEALKALIEGIAPGPGSYYVGRYRGFPIWVRRQQARDAVFTDVRLPTPSRVAEMSEEQVLFDALWRPNYTGTGSGLLQSMDANVPSEQQARDAAARAVAKRNEIGKLKVPEFRHAGELEKTRTELRAVNEELATQKDDATAAAMESRPEEDGGEAAEEADYEGGEEGEAEEEYEMDEGPPPADPGGGAGAGGRPPRGPRPPGDDADATPDGLPSDGPQPGEDGWQRRVREAKARNRKRARGGQVNAGVDPMHMADIAVEGAHLVHRGFGRFGAWSREMLRTLGSFVPGLRGMLRGIWNWIRQMFAGAGRGPTYGERPRPGFEEYRRAYEEGRAGQPGAGRRRYPWEDVEIPPEEVRRAAEEGARLGQEPAPEYGKPPKGDVNFDRIGGEPDIREWQARVVESLRPRWGRIRSFRTWAEARDYAVRAGLSEADFIRLVKERGAVTDIEIEAGRMMRQEGAEAAFAKLNRLKELQERRRQATDEQEQRRLDQEIMEADREYRDALARYVAVTSATVEAASELGRALNIHRKMAEAITPEEAAFRQLLRRHPGMSEKMQADLADAVMKRDAKRIREIARTLYKPGFLDYATEWFVNSLLSGLTTLEVNVLGNLSWEALFRTPERAVAGGIEAAGARQWVERIFGRNAEPRQRFGREFEEALRSHYHTRFGMLRALKYAWEFLAQEPGFTGVKGEFRPPAFPGLFGKVLRTPSRMMYALDLGSRWAAMEAEFAVQAVRRAITESRSAGGWTREQVTARMRELQDGYRRWSELDARRRSGEVLDRDGYQFLSRNPMYGRWQAALKQAGAKATFTDQVDRFSGALLQMRQAHPWLTFFIPFVKTPSRILAAAIHRSPWAAYDTFRKARAGELRGGELTDAMARVVYGNMIGASLYLLARAGLITGSGPADPRERAVLRETGWEPYSVKLGDTYVSLARLEPLGTHLGWAADLAEAQDVRGAGELYDKLIQAISLNIVNKTYLQGAIGLAEAVGDPERYGAHFGRKTLGAFVPNLLAQAARAIDPYVRETDTIGGTLLSRVPLLSLTLPPRRRGTGELMERREHPLSRWLNPFRYAADRGPEANLERIFLDVGYIPSNAPKTLTVPGTGGRKVALTSQERQLYSDYKERATRFARGLAQHEDFLALEPFQQEEILKRIYRYAHDAAHRAMVASVMQRAADVEWVK